MAGTELQEVVDEEDEVLGGGGADRRPARKANKWDWDRIFAYKTFKVVRIRDYKLGLLYWAVVTCVVMYIIIIAFHIDGKHAERDPGLGMVIVRFKGKAFAGGKVYDEADLRFPVIEPSGAFIMTQRVVMKDQTIGECVDMDSPRNCPCREGERCEGGQCTSRGWCPSLGDLNAASPPPGTQVERMEGLENTVLQIQSGIVFPSIGNYFYVTGRSKGASNPYSNITLGNLLKMATPKPIKVEDVIATGALVGVSFIWKCDMNVDCEPSVVIQRLDGGKGFVEKRAWHHRKNGQEVRDAIHMFGLRILVDSSGIGQRTSLVLIVIQIGSGLALLRLASVAADFLMLQLYSPDRKKAYYQCKVIETRDYSDLQDRINLVQDQANQEGVPAAGGLSMAGRNAAGTHVPLGLGPGGRGGLASAVLRGRSALASSSVGRSAGAA